MRGACVVLSDSPRRRCGLGFCGARNRLAHAAPVQLGIWAVPGLARCSGGPSWGPRTVVECHHICCRPWRYTGSGGWGHLSTSHRRERARSGDLR